MIKRLFAAAMLASLSTVATGADLPVRSAPAFAAPAPLFTWTGFYLGGNAGYVVGDTNSIAGVAPGLGVYLGGSDAYDLRNTSEGFTGGGQLGYNYQFGAGSGVVLGIEADLAYTDLTHSRLLPGTPPGLSTTFTTRLDNLGTVRGRLGYGFGPLLVYGTGGVAFGKANRGGTLTAGGATVARISLDDVDSGYAVGGGVEYALPVDALFTVVTSGTVTIKAEYLHFALEQNASPLSFGGQNLTMRLRNTGDLARTGINYKF